MAALAVSLSLAAAPATRPAEPADARTLVSAGQKLAAEGNHKQALTRYERALELEPNHGDAHAYRAASLIALGRLEEAEQSLSRALAQTDREFTYLMIAGRLRVARGQYDEAEKQYADAVRLSPRDAGAIHADLAAALAGRRDEKLAGRIDKALKAAASADPPSLGALFDLGQSYVGAGRPEGADYLRRYVDLASRLPREQRDERRLKVARQMIRAAEVLRQGG
jgi:tetratricopeptide (TPR) repeat protein